MSERSQGGSRLAFLACGAFRPALDHLNIRRRFPNIQVVYLPSHLHTHPASLRRSFIERLQGSLRESARPVCLYGHCFPDIHDVCAEHAVDRLECFHCYEMLLGKRKFQKIISRTTGSFFLERDLLQDFEASCIEPLELHDEEMRHMFFQHYRKLIYVRQPSDPDLVPKAKEVARFIDLALEVHDADYRDLESEIIRLIRTIPPGQSKDSP